MKIAVGSDHAAFELKEAVKAHIAAQGHEVEDMGCFGLERADYTAHALRVAEAVACGACERGILCCGTGIGMSIVANKVRGVRAALCADLYSARLTREHNDSNVICLGARVHAATYALEMVDIWLGTAYLGGRYDERLDAIRAAEEKYRRE